MSPHPSPPPGPPAPRDGPQERLPRSGSSRSSPWATSSRGLHRSVPCPQTGARRPWAPAEPQSAGVHLSVRQSGPPAPTGTRPRPFSYGCRLCTRAWDAGLPPPVLGGRGALRWNGGDRWGVAGWGRSTGVRGRKDGQITGQTNRRMTEWRDGEPSTKGGWVDRSRYSRKDGERPEGRNGGMGGREGGKEEWPVTGGQGAASCHCRRGSRGPGGRGALRPEPGRTWGHAGMCCPGPAAQHPEVDKLGHLQGSAPGRPGEAVPQGPAVSATGHSSASSPGSHTTQTPTVLCPFHCPGD